MLDTSICILGPDTELVEGWSTLTSPTAAQEDAWFPYLDSAQRQSQTVKNIPIDAEYELTGVNVYPKRISSNSSPAKTSIIITGEISGAVFEYDVTVSYYTS